MQTYKYRCPHCKEWVIYKPRKIPQLYYSKHGGLTGPMTRHKGFAVNLINVPHEPKFPFEEDN
jgi:hypothetical protein